MAGIISSIGNFVKKILILIISLLPKSPFVYLDTIPEVKEYLGYFNYFIPVSSMLAILLPWLVAVAIYYGVSLLLRLAQAVD